MKATFRPLVLMFASCAVLAGAQVDTLPGAGRVSVIGGEVSTRLGDTGDWAAAALNQPIVAGDKVLTGERSHAELQLDHASILRIGSDSQVKIATLEGTRIQVQVGRGLVYYTVLKDSEAEIEIDTPNVAIRPAFQEGVYRIEVKDDQTQVTVRKGAVEISTPQGGARVIEGQATTVRGTADEAGYVFGGPSSKDDWDSWNDDRDGVIRGARSWGHTNHYYVGSEDLDSFGRWVNVPEFGLVWSPAVAAGWAPYRAGRWVWEPYWGWTWVSSEPWGWTPYHYGRWFLNGSSWVWWPGPVDTDSRYRPVWAPAYVSFFGFGSHRGHSAGFRSVGWLPIGPADRFYPWYGQYGSHFNVVNVSTATDIEHNDHGSDGVPPLRGDTRFSNVSMAVSDGRVREAISFVPADRFGTAHASPAAIGREYFRNGYMMIGNLPIVPTRGSVSATKRPAGPSSRRGEPQERFFTRRQPAPAPQPFDLQAAQVRQAIEAEGQLIPVRTAAQRDSAGTAQLLSGKGVEGSVQPARSAKSGVKPRSKPDRGARTTTPAPVKKPKARATRRTKTEAHGSREPSPHTASRPGRDSRPRTAPRAPAPKAGPASRTTLLARAPRGAREQTTQVYLASADRQMDKGDYTAAIASSKHALQVDENNTAAKVRLQRARRAMLAENEITGARR